MVPIVCTDCLFVCMYLQMSGSFVVVPRFVSGCAGFVFQRFKLRVCGFECVHDEAFPTNSAEAEEEGGGVCVGEG